MQLKLLCLVTLVASVFADDPLATSLNSIAALCRMLNYGIAHWDGRSGTGTSLAAQGHQIAKYIASVKVTPTIGLPTDAVVKERREAVQSIAERIDSYLVVAIRVEKKVEQTVPPIKPLVFAVVGDLQASFLTLSKSYLAVFPDSQSQVAFDQINHNMQSIYNIYKF